MDLLMAYESRPMVTFATTVQLTFIASEHEAYR